MHRPVIYLYSNCNQMTVSTVCSIMAAPYNLFLCHRGTRLMHLRSVHCKTSVIDVQLYFVRGKLKSVKLSSWYMETVLKIVSCGDCVHSLDDILPTGLIEAIIAQVKWTRKTSGVLSFSETNRLDSSDDIRCSSFYRKLQCAVHGMLKFSVGHVLPAHCLFSVFCH